MACTAPASSVPAAAGTPGAARRPPPCHGMGVLSACTIKAPGDKDDWPSLPVLPSAGTVPVG